MLTCFGKGVAVADAEIRQVGNDNCVTSVTLACNRSYRSQEEWKEETAFVVCKAWGKIAERMGELIKKGTPVNVRGYIKTESWEKDGQKRSMLVLMVEDFDLVVKRASKEDGGDRKPAAQPRKQGAPARKTAPPPPEDGSDAVPDQNIPF